MDPQRLTPRELDTYGGVSQNQGYPFGIPHNKDYNIWGSICRVPLCRETIILIEKYTEHDARTARIPNMFQDVFLDSM